MRKFCNTLTFAFLALMLTFVSCKKDNSGEIIQTDPLLVGKWKLNATFLGTGYSDATWQNAAADDNRTLVFNSNGSVSGNAYPGYNNYAVKDSLLTLNGKAIDALKLLYTAKHDTLYLSPGGNVVCIEGCAVRYVKQ